MKKSTIKNTILCVTLLVLASCGSKRAIIQDSTITHQASTQQPTTGVQKITFLQKVSDHQVYAKNIVGNMTFTLKAGNKDDISVPGSIHMRKDVVIRLQLSMPLIGSEVGRLEFTPTYVLVVDRIHKQYVKADYHELDFLQQNGLNFYSLQALFWNQLLLPGAQKVSEGDLEKFDVNAHVGGDLLPVTLTHNNMHYQWDANRTTGRIVSAIIKYVSKDHGVSTLNWKYNDFKAVGTKMFPASQTFDFTTTASKKIQKMEVTIEMNGVRTDSDWDPETSVSNKYKKVEPKDVLGKLLSM